MFDSTKRASILNSLASLLAVVTDAGEIDPCDLRSQTCPGESRKAKVGLHMKE